MSVSTLAPPATSSKTRSTSRSAQFERYDTIDTPRIVVVGFLSGIITFVIILAAQAVFFAADHVETQRKAASGVPTPLTEGLTQQQNRLAGYGWVDPAKGVVNIPVSDAMKLVVEQHQNGQQTKGVASQ